MASTHIEPGLLSPDEKVPVQSLDDPFGFNAEVIYGEESFPLYRCTPFLTIYRTQHMPTTYSNERSEAEAEAEQTCGSPLTMAIGRMGNYKPQQMESIEQPEEEEWDQHPRTRMKRGGKKSCQKRR